MKKTLPLKECSIQDIYMDSSEAVVYKIPIYQRNYAWEEDQITALVKDVYDSMSPNVKDSSKESSKEPYYIGTLVTYRRGDNEYEVIDGQQRLTTIYLILKALGIEEVCSKLTYSARKLSADTIANLPNFGEEYDQGIRNGYSYAKKALADIVDPALSTKFKEYFLHKVHIIRYMVPNDVDLNHYFEVMNSRGEQLEKHEIVKSLLSQHLGDKDDIATFCSIWEACSDMNVYIQQVYPETRIFGNKLDSFNTISFDDIPQQGIIKEKDTILNLIQKGYEPAKKSAILETSDKFQPIIDFPNFLLIVLKLTLFINYSEKGKDLNIVLDDKDLLSVFEKKLDNDEINKKAFAKIFITNLLKAKYLLDNYIVHHTMNDQEQIDDNPWKLQCYYKENDKKKYAKNRFEDKDVQKELVQLLSMFEVSFTAKQRKNYLFYCLAFLFEDTEGTHYLRFVQELADKYFYDVYLNDDCLNDRKIPSPNAFDNMILQNNRINTEVQNRVLKGINLFEDIFKPETYRIPLFVFDYTDYRLWKKYAEDLRGNRATKGSSSRIKFFAEIGCSDFGLDIFNDFYFSRTRKSLEHFYPRAKAVPDELGSKDALTEKQINCFGNFAMIGEEANSSGSNWDPRAKLDHYFDKGKINPVSVASLKFRIMMQRCKDNSNQTVGWSFDDIKIHQKKMLDIILAPSDGLKKDNK